MRFNFLKLLDRTLLRTCIFYQEVVRDNCSVYNRPSGWVGDVEIIVVQGDACIGYPRFTQESNTVIAIQGRHFHRRVDACRRPIHQLVCKNRSTYSDISDNRSIVMQLMVARSIFVHLTCRKTSTKLPLRAISKINEKIYPGATSAHTVIGLCSQCYSYIKWRHVFFVFTWILIPGYTYTTLL